MIETKKGVKFDDLKDSHPIILKIIADVNIWCLMKGLPCIISSLFTDNVKVRKYKAHLEKRAVDISVKGFTTDDIDELKKLLERKYMKFAAISLKTGERCLIPPIDHGTAPHFHIQLYPWYLILKELKNDYSTIISL